MRQAELELKPYRKNAQSFSCSQENECLTTMLSLIHIPIASAERYKSSEWALRKKWTVFTPLGLEKDKERKMRTVFILTSLIYINIS